MNFLPGGVDDRASNGVTKFGRGAGGVLEGGEICFLDKYHVSTVSILLEEIMCVVFLDFWTF